MFRRKLPETQVDAVVPLLREDMQASLRTIRSLDARNRGRFREENNLAGMLRRVSHSSLACMGPERLQHCALASTACRAALLRTLKAEELEEVVIVETSAEVDQKPVEKPLERKKSSKMSHQG